VPVSIINDIYLSLPSLMQDAAITAYGIQQSRLRYATEIPSEYACLGPDSTRADIAAWQERRLRHVLVHASRYVPFYADYFRRAKIDPTLVTLGNYGEMLPIVEKAEIVAEPMRFVSQMHRESAIKLFTSGTSGSPMPVYTTRVARAINYLGYVSALRRHGCSVRDRSATFAGRVLFQEPKRGKYWRRDWFNNTLYFSSYFISPGSLCAYCEKIRDWNPIYIDAYPSAITQIAAYVLREGLLPLAPGLKCILTSSETLSEADRAMITAAFGVPVIDHYGCTEMAVSAYSFHPGKYEIDPTYCLVEVHPVGGISDGDSELICTSLINEAMPLLRYRIGDVVNAGKDPAGADRLMDHFHSVTGRQDDVVVTPEGRRIGRLDPAFKGVKGVSRAQIIQHEMDRLEVLVELLPSQNIASIRAILVGNIRARTSDSMRIDVVGVKAIPLARNGKFKAVVSKLPKDTLAADRTR
jgi:phenylacetate-CoA ligase